MCINNTKYIDPFTDFGFKRIFGTEKHKKFLISFLNDLLDIEYKIVDLKYRNLEKLGLNILDRKAIYDVYCTDEKGNHFIVELQRSKQKYFKDRAVYYTSFPIQEQSQRGDWDYYLEPIYFVGILEFKLDNTNKSYLTKVKLCDTEKKEVFYDKLTYYYIEMPKFNKKEKELKSHLEYWLWFMKNLYKLDEEPEIIKKDKVIKEAFDVASFLALSKDEQFAYMLDQKATLDYKNTIDYAKETAMEEGLKEGLKEGLEKGIQKGLEKGKKEGEKEAKIQIAKNLLKAGVDVKTVVISTGLDINTIEKLKKGE